MLLTLIDFIVFMAFIVCNMFSMTSKKLRNISNKYCRIVCSPSWNCILHSLWWFCGNVYDPLPTISNEELFLQEGLRIIRKCCRNVSLVLHEQCYCQQVSNVQHCCLSRRERVNRRHLCLSSMNILN